MRLIDLALKDLTQIVRDWKAAVFLVAMPIAFTLLLGFAFSGGEEDPRLPVGFVDQDGGSELGVSLFGLLEASGVVRPVVVEDADEAADRVGDEEWAAAVVVPDGYGEQLWSETTVPLTFIAAAGSPAGATAQGEIQSAAMRLVGAVQAARSSAQAFEDQGGFSGESARREYLEEALDRAIAAWQDPPLTVTATQSGGAAGDTGEEKFVPNTFAHYSAGVMVQFAMAGLMGAGEVMVLERKSRALRRMLTTALSRAEIILGHYLAMFVMIFLQLALLVGFGQLALGVDYMREPLAILLVVTTLTLWAAAVGLFIGVLARTEEQVIMLCLIPMLVLAALGGAWIPLEYTSATFQAVGHLTPMAWAMDGLENIIVRGLGLDSALLPVGILLAYGVAFFALAVWRFKFE